MRKHHFLLVALALVGVALVMAACATSNGTAPAAPAGPAGGKLTVLVTGTTWANLEPCG